MLEKARDERPGFRIGLANGIGLCGDLAGQTGVFQAQTTKGSRHRGLVLVAGLAMIGAGTLLMATSRQTEHEYVPVVSSGGMVVDSYIIERDKIQPGRLYGGMALAGGGGILVWQRLRK